MYILHRNENREIQEGMEKMGYPVRIMPNGVYVGAPLAVVLIDPMLDEIRSESDAIMYYDNGTRLVVISDCLHSFLIDKLFPESYVITHQDASICSSIERAIIGKIKASDTLPHLTETERIFLYELGYGTSNKELAARMNKSERTIRRIKESLLAKTGLVSSQQLFLYNLYRMHR